MTTRATIDLNVRVNGNQTFVGFEDVEGTLRVGETITVVESESTLTGNGTVVSIDAARELVYLKVEWSELKPGASPRSPLDDYRWSGADLSWCGSKLDLSEMRFGPDPAAGSGSGVRLACSVLAHFYSSGSYPTRDDEKRSVAMPNPRLARL